MDAKTRREKIRERTRKNYDTKDQGAYTPGKNVLNFDVIGGYNKDLIYHPEVTERGKKEIFNRIDILPFEVTTNNLRDVSSGEVTYTADVIVHRRLGPGQNDTYLCFENMYNESCPVCEDKRILKEQNPDKNLAIDPWKPKRRCFYNVIDLTKPEKEQRIQIFEEIHYWFEKELLERAGFGEGEFMDFWDPEYGCSIEFVVNSSKTPEGTNLNYVIGFKKRARQYSEKVMEKAYPLDKMIIRPVEEEIRNAYFQVGTGESNDSEPDNRSSGQDMSMQGEIPARDVNDDIRRPAFSDVDPHQEQQDEAPAHSSRRSRRRQQEEVPENKCPFGHVFGKDNELHPQDCSACDDDTFNKCDEERLRLERS